MVNRSIKHRKILHSISLSFSVVITSVNAKIVYSKNKQDKINKRVSVYKDGLYVEHLFLRNPFLGLNKSHKNVKLLPIFCMRFKLIDFKTFSGIFN